MRSVDVAAGRLERWCAGFAERHGGLVAVDRDGEALLLTGPDGATAAIVPPFPLPDGVRDLAGLFEWVAARRCCAVLLVRRGGYACALVETGAGSGAVTASKIGSRYVQSRTAAGGWSQQRFARRRENQARELASSAAEVALRLLVPRPNGPSPGWLATGGDRPLVKAVLADPRLRPLAALPRGPHLAVGDPRSDVVRSLPERLTAVTVHLTDPAGSASQTAG